MIRPLYLLDSSSNLVHRKKLANNLETLKDLYSPQVVFFDAGGTLLEVRGSVGEIYSRAASQYGLHAEAEQLQQNFARWFRLQPPLAFPGNTPADKLPSLEKEWWRTLVRAVFADCGSFSHFDDFFDDIFERFRGGECWRVYEDVAPTLAELKRRGLRLGIISNFDSRLDDVLRACELDQFFDSVHISTRVGAAKPDPAIFQAALEHYEIEPWQARHVGDTLHEDVEGAEAAGIQAILLDRNNHHADNPSRITNLNQLLIFATARYKER
jgi:putative hydrolase of the HAD superfamily